METGIEELRVVIEAISTLVNIKATLIKLILEPAGVPVEVYKPLFNLKDPITGGPMSKRKIAPLLIEGLQNNPNKITIIRSILRITAYWTDFSLAHNEYEARATVQKAQEVFRLVEDKETEEKIQAEIKRQAEIKKKGQERQTAFDKEADLLLLMFDDLSRDENHQRRGFLLQGLFNRLFTLHEITVIRSFTRNQGGEQIDGAFVLSGWHYLVECRWRDIKADIRQLDGLLGQLERSGNQTSGLFLSMNGWSDNVIPLLKQNPNKSIILMDGFDLRCTLTKDIDLEDFILAKVAKLNLAAEPYFGAHEYHKVNE